jgi:hypothetical protein
MFWELRQYKIKPGQMDRFAKLMEEEVIPFQVSKGMVIAGSFRGEQDETVWVWMRRFASEEERERLYKEVYESDHWKTNIAPLLSEMMERGGVNVTRIVATPRSVLQ